jgi:hypothetical protein
MNAERRGWQKFGKRKKFEDTNGKLDGELRQSLGSVGGIFELGESWRNLWENIKEILEDISVRRLREVEEKLEDVFKFWEVWGYV